MSQTPEERARSPLSDERSRTLDAMAHATVAAFEKGVREGRRAAFAECRKMVEGLGRHFPSHAVYGAMIRARTEEVEDSVWIRDADILANLTTMEESCTPSP